MKKSAIAFLLMAICLAGGPALAHDGLDLPLPVSAAEAWNVLSLCGANIEKLAAAGGSEDIGTQAFLSTQAIRYLLSQKPAGGPLHTGLNELLGRAERLASGGPRESAGGYLGTLHEVAKAYPAEVVHAAVYSCPMCKGIRELHAATRCPNCGMKLVERVIPASGTPGQAVVEIEPRLSAPLVAGVESEIVLRMTFKAAGKPVRVEDLAVIHTEPIHLLIIDESLSDYHHAHPKPGAVAGEYRFAFTPAKPGSYRVFADLTPLLSGVQEYPMCDLAGSAPGEKLSNRRDVSESSVGGLQYSIRWLSGGGPVVARRAVSALVTVSDAQGNPFSRLEPLMGAYAHIVGFYEDRRTVVHIHPGGAEPRGPNDRGGPQFVFRFHAPHAGYIRLYVQTQVEGVSQFAPFGLNVIERLTLPGNGHPVRN